MAIKHTEAYVVWRSHSQQMLDFAVLVSTAVPQLDHALRANDSDPSYFLAQNPSFRASQEPYSTEKRASATHQKVLGATLVLSIFSYFETYFFSVIDEIIEFHGGNEGFEPVIREQFKMADNTPMPAEINFLRKVFNRSHSERYRKYTAQAAQYHIMWPSQRFMLFGFKQAIQQRKRWRSADIPDLISNLLGMNISKENKDIFHEIRDKRNNIAHGKSLSYDLRRALDASNFFLELSRSIEDHVVQNFMIIERYAH